MSAFAALLVALATVKLYGASLRAGPPKPPPPPPPPKRAPRSELYTRDELAAHGVGAKTWLLSILGSVFDVSAGTAFYGPGQDYTHFLGRDASKAFVTGNYTADLTDDLSAFDSDKQFLSVVNWLRFYDEHEVYTREGWLAGGAFYDTLGKPTPALARALERADSAERALAAEQVHRRVAGMPRCRSSFADGIRAIWCDEQSHVPREVVLSGQPVRCVCVTPTVTEIPEGPEGGGSAPLAVPTECTADAARCTQRTVDGDYS